MTSWTARTSQHSTYTYELTFNNDCTLAATTLAYIEGIPNPHLEYHLFPQALPRDHLHHEVRPYLR